MIVLHYATKFLTVRVLAVPEKAVPAAQAAGLYEVLEERRDEPADWLTGI